MWIKRIALILLVFCAGVVVGGYLFSRSLPRSFLSVNECSETCYKTKDLIGLLASAGVQRADGLVPRVELESDECVAMRHPQPEKRLHLLLLPKYDVKDIGSIPSEAEPYVLGCIAMIGELARRHEVSNYRVVTNGPGFQDATYLHFHFLAP